MGTEYIFFVSLFSKNKKIIKKIYKDVFQTKHSQDKWSFHKNTEIINIVQHNPILNQFRRL